MISAISGDVVEYIEEKYPEIKTGKIDWITLKSLLPIKRFCEDLYDTPADYIIVHAYNVYNSDNLIECKPEDKSLIFWYLTDEVYIIDEECGFWEDC